MFKIEIHLDGQWVQAALLDKAQGGWWFEYLPEYAFGSRAVPVSLVEPVRLATGLRKRPPAFLFDLVPQGRGRAFLLSNLGVQDGDSDDLQMQLASVGAYNPIGNLRISTAVDFYRKHAEINTDKHLAAGFDFEEIVQRQDAFLEYMWLHAMLQAGTGTQGAAPKLLLTEDAAGRWHADAAIPESEAARHWLVKMPRGPGPENEAVLRNEHAYVEVVRRCGLRAVGRPEEAMLHGRMLFLPRFDRHVADGKVVRLHQESLASLAGAAGFGTQLSLFDLANALSRVVTHPAAEVAEFICRDMLNLALGNTDNHARNSAVQRLPDGTVQLTPFFDFAPMYLDPEMIVRNCRWRGPDGAEIHDLRAIIDGLDLDDATRHQVAAAVSSFGERFRGLEDIMHDCGVDPAVTQARRQYITNQLARVSRV